MDEQLIIRFLQHRCTPDETRKVREWIDANEENAQLLFEMEQLWSFKNELHYSSGYEKEKAYRELTRRLSGKNHFNKSVALRIKYVYAAVVFICLLISLPIYKWIQTRDHSIHFNTIEVPNGQRSYLTLSDGSTIWLNAGSKLSYPSGFSGKERVVYLEGEAYCQIAKNEKAPFIIRTSLWDIRVLGTEFNVRTYPGENAEVLLASGKVEVAMNDTDHLIVLNPYERLQYNPESGLSFTQDVSLTTIKSWTNGEVYFINQPLSEIINHLERKFDISILIEDIELREEMFTCHTQSDARLQDILDILKETRKIDYQIQEKEVIISKP